MIYMYIVVFEYSIHCIRLLIYRYTDLNLSVHNLKIDYVFIHILSYESVTEHVVCVSG